MTLKPSKKRIKTIIITIIAYVISLILAIIVTRILKPLDHFQPWGYSTLTSNSWKVFIWCLYVIVLWAYLSLPIPLIVTVARSSKGSGRDQQKRIREEQKKIKKENKEKYEQSYGIKLSKNIVITLISLLYCLYPLLLFTHHLDFSHIVVFTAMTLIEVTVVLYAGFDMVHSNNLRWYLRTAPYCITGLAYILCYWLAVINHHEGTFFKDDPLTTAVLSFITITYFVQVFNERFCKEQDAKSKDEKTVLASGDQSEDVTNSGDPADDDGTDLSMADGTDNE